MAPPALVQRNDDGGWDFDACGVLPAFDPARRNGATARVNATEGDTDDDDDTPVIATANGVCAYKKRLERRREVDAADPSRGCTDA